MARSRKYSISDDRCQPMTNLDSGANGLPHIFTTVVHMLEDAARRSPSATALVCGERRLSYSQYLRCVAGFAGELIQQGHHGAQVALVCGNSLDLPIAMFGVHAAGAQAVPINPAYTTRELAHILSDASPSAIVYDDKVAATIEPLIVSLGIRYAVRLDGAAGRRLDIWKDDANQDLPRPLPRPDDLANLQYTGGTTGLPKGVNITHEQMAINISQREAALPTHGDDERILCVMPLFHVFAQAMCLHLAAYCRGALIILPRYSPDAVFDLIAKEHITRLPAGPTVFIGLMNNERFASTDLASLRNCYSGAAPLPAETLHRWRERTGSLLLEGYGQSEAGPVLTYARDGGPLKIGSVGAALPLTQIEIVDVETGTNVLGIHQRGEIRARGPQIMLGYRNRAEENIRALRNGWLYTGDVGELDDDGYLYIRDRKKDMVIVGGYNVYPREVEDVLSAYPDVKEVAVVGMADAYYGEVVRAYVVLKGGALAGVDDLIFHCKNNLAHYKVPASICLLSALPRTSIGKIDRISLRQMPADPVC